MLNRGRKEEEAEGEEDTKSAYRMHGAGRMTGELNASSTAWLCSTDSFVL